MRTVLVFALLAAAVLTFGHYFSHDAEYLAYYKPDYVTRTFFGLFVGSILGVFVGMVICLFLTTEQENTEVARLAPLEGDIVGRSEGPRFVVSGRRSRDSDREYFYSRVNQDGTRELCGMVVLNSVQVLEDPELKDTGVYTIVKSRLNKKHWLAGWAINLHVDKHILRVPVGTVTMNFEVH